MLLFIPTALNWIISLGHQNDKNIFQTYNKIWLGLSTLISLIYINCTIYETIISSNTLEHTLKHIF